eukprot:TRINITY_DN822_c0_g1_i1.p1 TRINITY_DN822_c0_g1~~TRINITY_DN822_c0_g1_i1.p1  ORF type:complete len:1117 (+),score=313.61 TRINITY_DN822_c0_g1_i1:202-3552(+)
MARQRVSSQSARRKGRSSLDTPDTPPTETQVEETQVEETQVEGTQVEETQVEETQVDIAAESPDVAERNIAKRMRFCERDDDDYAFGNITDIELQNFMTYDHVHVQPSSRLNIVIGPNGTGKSSIVCALCIGLGGVPKNLGRAKDVGDYVKRGEDFAVVKVTLRGKSGRDSIVRKISKDNRSQWLLNGRGSTEKEILKLVADYNIQVGNLTQFLPQDKVTSFAKMSAIELLKETESSIGDSELPVQHEKLIAMVGEIKKLDMTVKQHTMKLQNLKDENKDLESDVERMKQRQDIMSEIEIMKKKEPWLRFDEKRALLRAKKEAFEAAKLAQQEILARILKAEAPLTKAKAVKAEADKACKELLKENLVLDTRRQALGTEETELSSQVRAKEADITELHRELEKRQEKLEKAEKDLAECERELHNLPEFQPPPLEEMRELGNQIKEGEMNAREMERQKNEKDREASAHQSRMEATRKKLHDIESVKFKKLEGLRKHFGGVVGALEWLDQNRGKLRRPVLGPILCEMNVANKEHAAFLEGHIPKFLFAAFITSCAEDRDFLMRSPMKNQFKATILNQEDDSGGNQQSGFVRPEYQSLGITHSLEDTFEAPEKVKTVLRNMAGINSSFVGTREAEQNVEHLMRLGVSDLWTPESHYRVTKSRYSNATSNSMQPVLMNLRFFSTETGASEAQELQMKLTEMEQQLSVILEERKQAQARQREAEDQAGKLHRKREELQGRAQMERKRRKDIESKINQRKNKLDSLRNQEDPSRQEARFRLDVSKLNAKRLKSMMEAKDITIKLCRNHMRICAAQLRATELDFQVKALEEKHKAKVTEGVDAQRQFEEAKEELDTTRKEVRKAKAFAEKGGELTDELSEKFAELPMTVEELLEAIKDMEARAGAILCSNPHILQEYEARCRQIEELQTKLEEETQVLELASAEVERVKALWLPRLRSLVSRINETFSRNFAEMAVAGEVELDEHGMEFEKYGILIKVQFRHEEGHMSVLSQYVQSGGERSVSTIMYLISLQDLSTCPFRVVDEINQGMDPNNERKMFQQLVRAASSPNTPQCFLLTPKLLPELEYNDSCCILNIMNGPWIGSASQKWRGGGNVIMNLSQANG